MLSLKIRRGISGFNTGVSGYSISEDGSFTVYTSQLGAHFLQITTFLPSGQQCYLFVAHGGVAEDSGRAQVFNINTEGTPRDINIRVPSDARSGACE